MEVENRVGCRAKTFRWHLPFLGTLSIPFQGCAQILEGISPVTRVWRTGPSHGAISPPLPPPSFCCTRSSLRSLFFTSRWIWTWPQPRVFHTLEGSTRLWPSHTLASRLCDPGTDHPEKSLIFYPPTACPLSSLPGKDNSQYSDRLIFTESLVL